MLIGYARVSTTDGSQSLNLQVKPLRQLGGNPHVPVSTSGD